MKDDLQLGKLKETVCYSSFIANPEKCPRALDGDRTRNLANRYISWPSLCHLSPSSSMVRASHRGSEGCGLDPRLRLGDIFLGLQ